MYYRNPPKYTIEYESSHTQTVETDHWHRFHDGIELRKQLKKHKRKWSKDGYIDEFYFSTAIDVAILILDNAQFNIEDMKLGGKPFPNATIQFTVNGVRIVNKLVQPEQEKTHQEPKASFDVVFPMISELIKKILDDTKHHDTSKKRKYRIAGNMMKLIDLARKKGLVDFNKFKPDKAEAEWQYAFLMKSLDTST